ncbi:MAG: hypothetical protein QM820_01565 [Minicystis sp.]
MGIDISVTVGEPSKTRRSVDRGLDVPVTITIDEEVTRGSVTLVPAEDGSPVYAAWGKPEDWVSEELLGALRDLDETDRREALDDIEAAASEVCGEP